MMNRKSTPISKSVRGNSPKFLSYREAKARIKLALENGFYFEAITIEESIICDRLLSNLIGTGSFKIKPKENIFKGTRTNLGNLLKLLKANAPHPIRIKEYTDLHNSLDQWREQRNECLHSIVKSFPGKPTNDIDDFLKLAKKTAIEGNKLSVAVQQWHKKMKPTNY